MKIVHIAYCFYPDQVGGTEVYVKNLCDSLSRFKIESIVAAPTEDQNDIYFHEGIKVRRFSISKRIEDLSDLYGGSDPVSLKAFGRILDEEKPDLAHFHALTYAVSLGLMREAKSRGIPAIFTYHTPTASCQRGTLMYMGKEACDGKLYPERCARCALQGLGLFKTAAGLFALMPKTANDILGKINLSGGIFTAIRMKGLISKRINAFSHLMEEVDHIVTVCDWARDLLLNNHIPNIKISVIRHGLSDDVLKENKNLETSFIGDEVIKLIYIGRLNPVKGVDVLIRAISSLPDLQIKLHIYGIIQSEAEKEYLKKLIRLTKADPRIVFKNTVSNDKIIPLIRNYDILAVPSQWLETGPLVVLEAFVTGVPVIGSSLGGIAELVEDEVNGLLVAHDSMDAWRCILKRISGNRELIIKLRLGVHSPKKMSSVARETKEIYEKVASKAQH